MRLLILLPAILTPACASSSLVFCKIYSICRLNKQGDHTQSWRTPFPIWNQSLVLCLILAVASMKYKLYNFDESSCELNALIFGFLVAKIVKNLPAMWETRVWSLGQEDDMKEDIATYSGILAWRIAWTEDPDRLPSMGLQRVGHIWVTNISFHFHIWFKSDIVQYNDEQKIH